VRQPVRVDGVHAGAPATAAVGGVQLVGDGEGLHEAVGLWLTAAPARGRQNDWSILRLLIVSLRENKIIDKPQSLLDLAWLDRMIVYVETGLTPLLASIALRAGAGLEADPLRDLLAHMERHLNLLYRNRELLLKRSEPRSEWPVTARPMSAATVAS
jgi:hypothetical protein